MMSLKMMFWLRRTMLKLLPYPQKPIFIAYHCTAFPFGMIEANAQTDITAWTCSKTVNCVFRPLSPLNKFDMAIRDTWGTEEGILTQQHMALKPDFFKMMDIDITSMLKKIINNNCYIQGNYNEKYIPGKGAYGVDDHKHDFLIIGYNEHSFISAGFLGDGRFHHFEIPYENFVKGLISVPDDSRIVMNFFSYNNDAVLKPNISRMIDDLDRYISTLDDVDSLPADATSYGIAALINLKNFFVKEVNDGKIYLDIRYSRVLYEHKWMLMKLVEHFLENEKATYCLDKAVENFEKAQRIHWLGMKMGYTSHGKIINRIEKLMGEIISTELEYIPVLIRGLRKKYQWV